MSTLPFRENASFPHFPQKPTLSFVRILRFSTFFTHAKRPLQKGRGVTVAAIMIALGGMSRRTCLWLIFAKMSQRHVLRLIPPRAIIIAATVTPRPFCSGRFACVKNVEKRRIRTKLSVGFCGKWGKLAFSLKGSVDTHVESRLSIEHLKILQLAIYLRF